MGEFNKDMLNVELQDPVNAPANAIYKVEDHSTRVDFIAFAKRISDNEDDFEEYLDSTKPVDKFGEEDENKIEEDNKENYKAKSRYLISCIKIFSEYKDSAELKAHFDLISTDCPSSKSVLISFQACSAAAGNLLKNGKKYIETNKSLTLYAFRWKSKGMLPTMKSMVPSLSSILDIASLFNKAYLAYRAIKIPFEYREKFMDNWEMSKVYGKILAHALLIHFPFINQSVSLIGFNIGAQILYSCLEELHHKKAFNIIHNVYFIIGAVDSSDRGKWAQVLSVVRGTVYNYYSAGEKGLHLFRTVTFKTPIGIIPLLEAEPSSSQQSKAGSKNDVLAKE
eukprot:CAMPEP_0168350864 /NCGR_PEP_ID=MMETSP0213-20121227/21443_1 /TAXON_ID=151035 /ORGANISM="Euplotes harpa, Strain FSP1.4" /LENGTH=337 /DNA_ID=CAMNT_0008361433 /DNA_START=564 /DNA_END=1575 /DNA_ORIENTATION=+